MNRKEYFDKAAEGWDEKFLTPRLSSFLETFVPQFGLEAGQHVLDVGTGTGVLIPYLVKTVGPSGKITAIDTAQTGYGRFPAIILDIETTKGITQAFIAPSWYLGQQKLRFKKGDSISVTGSKVTYLNKKLIISKQVNYKKNSFNIRNDRGVPVWSGKMMGPGRGRGRRN